VTVKLIVLVPELPSVVLASLMERVFGVGVGVGLGTGVGVGVGTGVGVGVGTGVGVGDGMGVVPPLSKRHRAGRV
jgi:hypothetical protein